MVEQDGLCIAAEKFWSLSPAMKYIDRKDKIAEFEYVTVDEADKEMKQEEGQVSYYSEDLGNGISLDMVSIPGGIFMMGTEDEEIERLNIKYDTNGFNREKPQHKVTVQPFYMGRFQITQAQWKAISSLPKIERDLKLEPSCFKSDMRPVERVSWFDAVEFCQRLSKQTVQEYRLPCEAEWEYACRAGTTTRYYFGDDITDKLAKYKNNIGKTTTVGKYPPNTFGLYDMHGNVWEWCQDDWHENYIDAPNDGSAWVTDEISRKIIRGGSFGDDPGCSRSAFRGNLARDYRNCNIGFRVVCVDPRT